MVERGRTFWAGIYLAFGIVAFFVFSYFFSPLDRETIPVSFILGNRTGFDLSPGNLTFGMIAPKQSSTRAITIRNEFEFPVRVAVKVKGEISSGLIVSENNFLMDAGASKELSFSIYADDFTEFRKYSGEIEIVFWKAGKSFK